MRSRDSNRFRRSMYKQTQSMERLGVHPFASAQYPMEDGCLSRVPYSSVIAFVMCFIGVIMFAIMMIFSFNASVEQARRALEINNIPWLDKVHLLFLIVAVVMIAMALYLLCVGILSTGSTREEIYKRPNARRGGRICCVVAIILAYLLNILWILVLSITAILSAMYYLFSQLCSSFTVYSETSCLDFSVFRPLVRDFSDASLNLCGGNVQQFCALTNTVITWYLVGFTGSLIICLGLVQFIATNSANYCQVNNEERYSELRDIVFSETYPDYSTSPNIYAPPKYPLAGTNTMSTYNSATQPRNPMPANMHQGSLLRQQQYPHSRRNSYHHSLPENNAWMSYQY
ncbi:hypothetical protein M3Y94_01162100 [Aphelenchoides besseyi]|nr:hypothetical protein M3Y94_01162100 [Aphelenchoides besseyi]KAI6228080.1 hypothetical protein M3Y95_00584700 [Aphelenchoides besseyi]